MDWSVIATHLPFLMKGLWMSVKLATLVVIFAFPLACLIAVGRISSRSWIRYPSAIFVNTMRSNPLILIVFWFFFLVPIIIGRPVGDFASVMIGFIVFFSAYFTEIIRSGIQSVGRNQIQAGLSTGLTYFQTMRMIVLPQALRNMMPALITECVIVFQGTTIAYVVGLREFLNSTFLITEITLRPAELYTFAAIVYFVVCFAGSSLARQMEKRKVRT
ncbi:MAG: amino acid ABC transporter permease [Rhodospirillales bacterium]|nr:amino acid ABC transporter permease [Rhodospirillales bacterium]